MILYGLMAYLLFAVFSFYLNLKDEMEVSSSNFDFGMIIFIMTVLGSCLMGTLPLILLECIFVVNNSKGNNVGENVVSGLVYMEAMAIAAVLTYVTTNTSGIINVLIVGCLLALGSVGIFAIDAFEEAIGEVP